MCTKCNTKNPFQVLLQLSLSVEPSGVAVELAEYMESSGQKLHLRVEQSFGDLEGHMGRSVMKSNTHATHQRVGGPYLG